jgi:hypothetical protein
MGALMAARSAPARRWPLGELISGRYRRRLRTWKRERWKKERDDRRVEVRRSGAAARAERLRQKKNALFFSLSHFFFYLTPTAWSRAQVDHVLDT